MAVGSVPGGRQTNPSVKTAFTALTAATVPAIVCPLPAKRWLQPSCNLGCHLPGNSSLYQEIQAMPFDWKDIITPIVTVTEVLGDIIMYDLSLGLVL